MQRRPSRQQTETYFSADLTLRFFLSIFPRCHVTQIGSEADGSNVSAPGEKVLHAFTHIHTRVFLHLGDWGCGFWSRRQRSVHHTTVGTFILHFLIFRIFFFYIFKNFLWTKRRGLFFFGLPDTRSRWISPSSLRRK